MALGNAILLNGVIRNTDDKSKNACKYALKWPSIKHMLLYLLTFTDSSGLSGYLKQMFWLTP